MPNIKKPNALSEATAQRTRKRRSELKAEVAAAAILAPNDLQPTLVVQMWPVEALYPPKVNARTVDAEHVASVRGSMAAFANVVPILIAPDPQSDGAAPRAEIIDGVARLEAAKALGLTEVPCIAIHGLSPAKRKALRLRLNREQEKGGWDLEKLGAVLVDIKALSFDLGLTGFVPAERDLAITVGGERISIGPTERAADLAPSSGPPITRRGDLFRLGNHRFYCGDSLVEESYRRLMGGRRAKIIITDAPFNRLASTIGGRGRVKHGNFEQGSGEMSDEAFASFLRAVIALMIAFAIPGAYFYLFIDWQHLVVLIEAAIANGLVQKNLIVWDKGHAGMGGLYRSAHELIPLFLLEGGESCDQVKLGRYGRDRTNIFRYPGANTMGSSARSQLHNHPTPKSVECIADMMLDASEMGDAVLDVFVGSGTVFIAAERTGRHAYGIELSPAYCDVAIRRWERETGEAAVLDETGETFAELALRRNQEMAPVGPGDSVEAAPDPTPARLPDGLPDGLDDPAPSAGLAVRPRVRVKAVTG